MKKLYSYPVHLSSLCLTRISKTVEALRCFGYLIRSGIIVIVLVSLSWTIPVYAEWNTETCINRGGLIITGANNNMKFCRSNVKMNWWSANTWCQKHGGQLADAKDACPGAPFVNGASCNNIPYSNQGIPDANFGWLRHTQIEKDSHEIKAWVVSKHGGLGIGMITRSVSGTSAYAICSF